MANITKGIDELYPDWNWYEDSLDNFVDEASLKGIIIGEDRVGKGRTNPAISFSGFSSQGDGLCFDCDIKWPAFIDAHPDFKEKLPEWFLLLSANPDYVVGGMNRSYRGNTMTVVLEFDYPDVVEAGFFAGLDLNEDDMMPGLVEADLEEFVKDTCEDLASDWYHRLDKEYDFICDDMRQQRVSELIEENKEELKPLLLALPAEFTRADVYHDDIDFVDLDNLGLVEHVSRGVYHVSDAGKELL